MRNYRILILYQSDPPFDPSGIMAGAQRATVQHAEYLAQNGGDVTVMSPLTCLPCKHHGVYYIDIKNWSCIIKALKKLRESWDVVYCVGSPRLLKATYIMPYLRYSLLRILTIHVGPSPSSDNERIEMINRYADAVICVSKAAARAFVHQKVKPEKMHVVYNGVDSQVFRPQPVPRSSKQIVFAGALIPKKGIDTLLIAFDMVKSKIPEAKLVICGSPDLYGVSEDWLKGLPIPSDGSVQFRGKLFQMDLAREFSQAGLAAFPSSKKDWFEAFGIVSIEAQACGCPVVVSDNGGLPETIIDGITGRLCLADNPKALASIIIELLSKPDRLRTMGVEAVKHVQKNFLWEHNLKPLKDIIEGGVKVNSIKK